MTMNLKLKGCECYKLERSIKWYVDRAVRKQMLANFPKEVLDSWFSSHITDDTSSNEWKSVQNEFLRLTKKVLWDDLGVYLSQAGIGPRFHGSSYQFEKLVAGAIYEHVQKYKGE